VLGRPPFHDTSLTTSGHLAYVGGNWTRDIAFAGTSIPLTVCGVPCHSDCYTRAGFVQHASRRVTQPSHAPSMSCFRSGSAFPYLTVENTSCICSRSRNESITIDDLVVSSKSVAMRPHEAGAGIVWQLVVHPVVTHTLGGACACQGPVGLTSQDVLCVIIMRSFLQGDFPASKMIDSIPGADPERKARLIKVLDIDPSWRMHTVSDGQRRRVQICVGLLRPFKVSPRRCVTKTRDAWSCWYQLDAERPWQ